MIRWHSWRNVKNFTSISPNCLGHADSLNSLPDVVTQLWSTSALVSHDWHNRIDVLWLQWHALENIMMHNSRQSGHVFVWLQNDVSHCAMTSHNRLNQCPLSSKLKHPVSTDASMHFFVMLNIHSSDAALHFIVWENCQLWSNPQSCVQRNDIHESIFLQDLSVLGEKETGESEQFFWWNKTLAGVIFFLWIVTQRSNLSAEDNETNDLCESSTDEHVKHHVSWLDWNNIKWN